MWEDGENKAYAILIQRLWDKGLLTSYSSPRACAECLLGEFLDPERVEEVVNDLPLEPPSEDGWYLVQVKTPSGQEMRKLYFCRRYARGCDPWWKGFLGYGETPVKHEIGAKDGETVVSWSKVSSGDRANISQDVIDRLSTPYNLSAGWIKASNTPLKAGEYLTLFWDGDYADINVYNYVEGWYNWDDEPTELVDYWRPLPQLPEDQ